MDFLALKVAACSDHKSAKRIRDLELDLARQWLTNHAEHCGAIVPPWPHQGDCHWLLPAALARLTPSEVYLLLLQASEVSFGLQLRASEG